KLGTAGVRRTVAVVRGAGLLGAGGPGAAEKHALLRCLGLTRASVRWRVLVVRMPRIGAPFPHVAMHVVEAPGVGLLDADGRVVALGVAREPGILAQVVDIITERKCGGRAGAAAVLPLRFRRQARSPRGPAVGGGAIRSGGRGPWGRPHGRRSQELAPRRSSLRRAPARPGRGGGGVHRPHRRGNGGPAPASAATRLAPTLLPPIP